MLKDIEKASTKNLYKSLEFVLIKKTQISSFYFKKDSDFDHASLK